MATICCLQINSFAQTTSVEHEKNNKRIRFSGIQQVEVIGNSEQVVPAFQVVFGAQYKRYFLGVGAAIDPYYANSFPLFADARYTFFDQRFSSYVYGDLGINKMMHSSTRYPKTWENGQPAYSLQNGLYYDYGLGMKIKLAGNLYYNFSMGVSFKESNYSYSYNSWQPQFPLQVERYRNVASRFSVKMGLQF